MGRRTAPKFGIPRVASVATALAVVLAVSACGSGGSSSTGTAGKRVLRYGYDLSAQFTNTFDVQNSKGDCDAIAMAPIYDTLVHKKPGNKLEPGLLESWKIVDPSTIDLTLRSGLTFSDGTPLDAATLEESLKHNAKSDQLTDLHKIDTYTVVDAHTLRLKLTKPIAAQMPATFTSRDGMPMKPGSTSDHPIGAGPFTLASYQPGSKIALAKNPKYWDKNAYQGLDEIDLTQTGTGPPAVSALLAGDLDLVRMEADSYNDVKNKSGYGVVVQPSGAYLQFEFRQSFHGKATPFANKLVRQAVSYALDRKKINDVVQNGLGEVASQPFPKDSPDYVPDVANLYPYDPQKAKDLLTQAGYANGFSFDMAIPSGVPTMQRQGTLVQQMLDAVGIKAKITPILGSDIGTQFYILGKGDAFAAAELDTTFPTGKIGNNYGKGEFVAIWDGAERQDLTDLMTKASSATSLDTTNQDVRQAVTIAMNDALDVPIAFMPQLMAYNTNRLSGKIGGQTNICDPPDLSQVVVKGS